MNIKKKNLEIFQAAFKLLSTHEETMHSQVIICNKLKFLGKGVSPSLFSRLVTQNDAGSKTIQRVVSGLKEIIQEELAMAYDDQKKAFVIKKPDNWQKKTIPEKVAPPPIDTNSGPLFHYDGRRTIQEKTGFIANAQQEVIFLGVRLKQFCSYFLERKDAEFKEHILRLLQRGVRIKCYLANPDTNAVRFYFQDRSSAIPKEKNGEALIPEIIRDLQRIRLELMDYNLDGSFQIFTYAHLPTTHFLCVDQDSLAGKMLVSNYTFGVARSKVPVIEVYKRRNKKLFELYQRSLHALVKDAKDVSIKRNGMADTKIIV